jgi:hypothetical protein
MEHAVKVSGFPPDKAEEFLRVAEARCDRANCSGLEPCDFCVNVRIGLTIGILRDPKLTKKQIEDFNDAYGEAFKGAVHTIRKMKEDLAAARVAEKEALEKKAQVRAQYSPRKEAGERKVVEKNGATATPQTSKPEEKPPASSSQSNQE